MNNDSIEINPKVNNNDKIGEFLSETIHQLKSHKLLLETETMNSDMKKFYDQVSNGDIENLLKANIEQYRKLVFLRLITDYFKKLSPLENLVHLGININDTKLLVWAEIDENDEESENKLIDLQAHLNYLYKDSGVLVSTTIVENTDYLTMPPHYEELLNNSK